MTRKTKHKMGTGAIIKYVIVSILSAAVFIATLFYTVTAVASVGGYASKVVTGISPQQFKFVLNCSMPIINICYNSGMASISVLGEVRNIFCSVYGISFTSPISILGAQFSAMESYNRTRKTVTPHDENKQSEPEQGEGLIHAESSIRSEDEYEITPRDKENENIIEGQKVSIRNETKIKVDIDELGREPLKIRFYSKGPAVLIYHTHTTEAYSRVYKFLGGKDPRWDTNPQNSVVRVGSELAAKLKKKHGIDVIHNGSVHDYPSYSGSYERSLNTVQSILKSYPSIKIVLDIHRDALSDEPLRMVKSIEGMNAAQIMLVVGTNEGGLWHPYWRENLKLAVKLQTRMNALYPGLARPINLRTGRFNQHVSSGALLLEVGGDGNTLEEALRSTEYIAGVLAEVISDAK